MADWEGKSKGTPLGYRIFIFTIKAMGLPVAYLMLRFVTFYYYLFAKKARKSIINFYTTGLGFSVKEAKKMARKNFNIFGQTLVDRVAVLAGRKDKYSFTFNGEHHLVDIHNQGQGGVFMGAHLGNWETAGNFLSRVSGNCHVLMYNEEVEKIKNVIDKTTGGARFKIIAIDDNNFFSHIIKIKKVLDNNEIIAVLADRTRDGSKTMEVNFLNQKMRLPLGPFQVGTKFKALVTFVYAVKSGNYKYDLYATEPFKPKSVEELASKYVAQLEKMVKKHPEQWFNYYDYFNQ